MDSISFGDQLSVRKQHDESLYLLGLSGSGHDSAATLIQVAEGHCRLLATVEEERWTRIKHEGTRTPVHAVREVLRIGDVPIQALACVAIGWDFTRYAGYGAEYLRYRRLFAGRDLERVRSEFGCRHLHQGEYNAWLSEACPKKLAVADFAPGLPRGGYEAEEIRRVERLEPARYLAELEEMFALLGRDRPPVVFVRHHLAHAASAYYASGFADRTLVLVVDGAGEGGDATTLWLGEGTALSLQEVRRADCSSFGRFYTFLTSYLGFEPFAQEGHVMGLAPWGDPARPADPEMGRDRDEERARVERIREAFGRFCRVDAHGMLESDPEILLFGTHDKGHHLVSDELDALLSPIVPPRHAGEPILAAHANFAFVLQSLLEDCLTSYVRHQVGKFGCRRLAIAGGVGLNAKSNGGLLRHSIVDDLFVQPLAGDAGTALGAALEVAKQRYGADPRFAQRTAALGPQYRDIDITCTLTASKMPHRRLRTDEITRCAARLITTGHPIAWFQGRREIGPRALFSTSILVDATDPLGNLVTNRAKGRRWWRPSAVSLTPHEFSRLLLTGSATDAPFMITTFTVKPEHEETIRAGLHPADRSTRPQVVHAGLQPIANDLLRQVGRITGVEAVLNTSFNRQEPIVHTPEQALATLSRLEGVDFLFMGEHAIWKQGADPSWLLDPKLPIPKEWTCDEIPILAARDAKERLARLLTSPPRIAAMNQAISAFCGEYVAPDRVPARHPVVSSAVRDICLEWFLPALVIRISAPRNEVRLRMAACPETQTRRTHVKAISEHSGREAGVLDGMGVLSFTDKPAETAGKSPPALKDGLRLLSQRLRDLLTSREMPRQPAPRVVFLGRVSPSKGVEEFLLAVRYLRERLGGRIQAALHGALDARDIAAWRDQIMSWIEEYGLAEHVTLTGQYRPDQIPALIADADLVILPSRREGFTLASLEAMACGKPLVLTAVGGNVDLFRQAERENLEIGAVVETRAPQGGLSTTEIAGRIADESYAILSKPGVAVRMGLNARALATAVYSESRIGEAWRKVLAELAGPKDEHAEIRIFLVAPGKAPWQVRGGGEHYLIQLFRRLHHWEETGPIRFRVSLLAFREHPDQQLDPAFLIPPQCTAANLTQMPLFQSKIEEHCPQDVETAGEQVSGHLSRLFDAVEGVDWNGGRPSNSPAELKRLTKKYVDALTRLNRCYRSVPYYPVMHSRPVRELWPRRFRGMDSGILDRAIYDWDSCNYDTVAFNLSCLAVDLDALAPQDAGIALFWGRPYTFLAQVLLSRAHNVPYLVHEGVFEIETIFDYLDRDLNLPEPIKRFTRQHLVLVYASVLYHARIIAPQASVNHEKYRDWFGIESGGLVLPNCIDVCKTEAGAR